ncbi:MAG: transcriptional activator RfaH [Magnetospirillum sp.]|nr:transcriptional activator RfaH [Magnetospirillum sp.]
MMHWYAVQTHPAAEARAVGHLGRQGFETFYPRYRKQRRHARRTEIVEAPLFPGYVFVQLDMDGQPWRAVHSTLGVRRLVCSGEMPVPVPGAVMDEIKARGDGQGLVAFDAVPGLSPGASVEITGGPFEACTGIFEELDDQRRVILLLDLLGRPVRLAIAADAVRPSA